MVMNNMPEARAAEEDPGTGSTPPGLPQPPRRGQLLPLQGLEDTEIGRTTRVLRAVVEPAPVPQDALVKRGHQRAPVCQETLEKPARLEFQAKLVLKGQLACKEKLAKKVCLENQVYKEPKVRKVRRALSEFQANQARLDQEEIRASKERGEKAATGVLKVTQEKSVLEAPKADKADQVKEVLEDHPALLARQVIKVLMVKWEKKELWHLRFPLKIF